MLPMKSIYIFYARVTLKQLLVNEVEISLAFYEAYAGMLSCVDSDVGLNHLFWDLYHCKTRYHDHILYMI